MPQYSGMWTLSQVSQAVKNQTWTGLPPSVVEYLVVAGAGGGGTNRGGGGGAGGLLQGYAGITSGTSYFVTVGAGGNGGIFSTTTNATVGSTSVFDSTTSGASTGRIVASGGGRAGGFTGTATGASGGSGGGAGGEGNPAGGGSGSSGQGTAGGQGSNFEGTGGYRVGGGGGGAGSGGMNGISAAAGNGGMGIASSITGSAITYAGGGGGGTSSSGALVGSGGIGGGGAGALGGSVGTAGSINSGGGGGGGANNSDGAAGGSGVVIIRYPGTTQFFTGGTLSYANGYVIHTFYANGTLVPIAGTLYANPDYQISRSLRFNSADSPHLSRTPASTSSQTTATFSAWIKRSQLGTFGDCRIFTESTGSGTGLFWIQMVSDKIGVYVNGNADGITSTQVFRDPSAWYHIVVAVDTTQATSTDRIKMYVNNVQITAFTGTQTYYTQGQLLKFNVTTSTNHIGYVNSGTFDGYMADINWIDGQALTPSSFGWTNPATGVWAPLDFVGTYGTNGFNLNFSDNSNTTAGTLGADSSGNGNNFTPNNFSVSAGAGNDSLVDTPTPYGTDTGVGGEVRGNYATLSPLFFNAVTTIVPTNGNLDFTFANPANRSAYGSIGMSTGKWYCEVIYTTLGGSPNPGLSLVTGADTSTYLGFGSAQYSYDYGGTKVNNNSGTAYGASWTTNDVIGVAFDADAGTLTFYKNGVSQGVAFTGLTAGTYVFGVTSYNGGTGNINFGQRAFAYTAPSGYKALCSTNLPAPTIGATSATTADKFFTPVLYTGTSATRSVGVGFQPDFVWLKPRNTGSYGHKLFDSVRGATKYLETGGADPEGTVSGLTSFDAGGFTVGSYVGTNSISYTFVAWNWKASGTAVSNTSGSISSQVSASPASGFSIVTYTGTGANATVGHGLGVAPSMIITKSRSDAGGWAVYHISTGASYYLLLNGTGPAALEYTLWNNTAPTSTTFSIGTSGAANASAATYVAYCFAPVAGYSAFGSYIGNGNASGPFVHLGFRPAFLLIRSTGNLAGYQWFVFDNKRDPYNLTQNPLGAGISTAEPISASGYRELDMLSNGFKIRADGDQINYSTQEYIYMAFAENPFKYSLAR